MYDTLFYTTPVVDMTVPIEGCLPIHKGATTRINTIINEPGGPANILIAGKRMGLNIFPIGAVGDDFYGRFLLEAYKKEGIDVSGISVITGYETQKVIVLVDENGAHSYISMINDALYPLPDMDKAIQDSKSICVSGYTAVNDQAREETLLTLRSAKAKDKIIFFDPGPLIEQIPTCCMDEILAASTVVVLNHEEASLVSGVDEVETAAKLIREKTSGTVVVKAGGKGCYIVTPDDQKAWYSGFSVPLVDTTGAGDSFLGAFMYAYLSKWDMETVAYFSNAVGAAKVAKRGSGTQVPTCEEVIFVLEQGGFKISDSIKGNGIFRDLVLHKKDS